MALDWMCLGGVEVVNNCRVSTYARNGWASPRQNVRSCGCCDGLDTVLGETYNNPGTDQAPWFDPSVPDSFDFGGLLVTEITGLDIAPFERPAVEIAAGGAVLGRGRYGPRTIVVTGVLIGRTECATAYGLRWLTSALRGSCGTGASGCVGDDLQFYVCCPPLCSDDDTDPADCLAPYRRTLRRAALTSGPTVLERLGTGCDCGCGTAPLTRVQFTVTAGQPYAFHDPILVCDCTPFVPLDRGCQWTLLPDDAGPCEPDVCAPPPDCTVDPNCPLPVPPPRIPLPANPCICDPIEVARACCDIPADVIDDWGEAVPVITLSSGSRELRNITVRIVANPTGQAPDDLDPCAACSEITVAYVPPFSELVIDGTEQALTITCPGGSPTAANAVVAGPAGRPLVWPTLDCGGTRYTVCAEVDAGTIAPGSCMSVAVVGRDA